MEIRQLQYFYILCKCKNYTRASRELFITQPTLSQQISSLENNLGLNLIDHSTKTFALTKTGERFLEMVEKFIEKYNIFIKDVDTLRLSESYVLSYASLNQINAKYSPDLFSAFSDSHPNMTISHSTTMFYNIITFVQDNLVDVSDALIYSEKNYDNVNKIILEKNNDELVIVIPNNSQYSDIESFDDPRLPELLNNKCYLFDGWRDYEIPLQILSKISGHPLQISYYTGIIEFLSQPHIWKEGFTILPYLYLTFIQGGSLFKFIHFPNNECALDKAILYNPSNKNPATKAFVETIKKLNLFQILRQ